MALLGASIDPSLFRQDYSGFVNAANTNANAIAGLGQTIAGGIERYGEEKQNRKKLDAGIKASVTGIESAIKMGKSLGIDIESSLSPYLQKINDPNISPIEAAAYAQQASSSISNVLTFGMKANDMDIERRKLSQDAAYKNEELRISQQNANSRAAAAIASGGSAPPTVDMPLGDGSTQKMQWDKESQSYTPIQVSKLGDKSQSASGIGGLPTPLQPFANDFKVLGTKYGVDPTLLAAIAMHETANGTSSAFRNKNNAMGVSNASGPVEMESVTQSIEKMASLIGSGINQGTGPYANVKSIEDLASIYAPVGAGNDPNNLNKSWTQGVSRNIEMLAKTPTQDQTTNFGYTPKKPKEAVKIVTGEEAKALGLKPENTYEAKSVDGEPTGYTVLDKAAIPTADAEKANEASLRAASDAAYAIETVNELTSSPGFPDVFGAGIGLQYVPGTAAFDADVSRQAIVALATTDSMRKFQGLGSMSDAEFSVARSAATQISQGGITEIKAAEELNRLRDYFSTSIRRAEELGRIPKGTSDKMIGDAMAKMKKVDAEKSKSSLNETQQLRQKIRSGY